MNGDDSWINTNRATRGGVNYNLGTLKMRDFEIYGNFAEANGGVNYNDGGNLTLINVTAGNNEAIRTYIQQQRNTNNRRLNNIR